MAVDRWVAPLSKPKKPRARLEFVDVATGDVKDFEVTADEGELFSGLVGLVPLPPP